MARAWRIFGVTLVLSTYFVMAPFGYGIFAIWGAFPTRNRLGRARIMQGFIMAGFGSMHAILRWMRILNFDPRKIEGKIPSYPCVLVANHPTLTDISALLATERGLVFPVKPDLFGSFWARPLLAQADYFAGTGSDGIGVGQVIADAVDRIERGYRVVIFPEGTRSPEEGLHAFGRTAFEIAVRAKVPVVPLVITCTPRWLARNHGFMARLPSIPNLRIRALAPVQPDAAGSSSRTLRDIVSRQIGSELEHEMP